MLTDEQKRMLCGLIGEEDKIVWFCPYCNEAVDGRHVTYDELHDECGYAVYNPPNRAFDTWDDLGAVKEALVEKGLWEEFCISLVQHLEVGNYVCGHYIFDPEAISWLFDPARFFNLVCKWMEERKLKNES